MSNTKYLLLWLEAPLQSWGFDSKFDRRESLDFPTKSGVLGLICCARGAGGEERHWLAEWAEGDMQVVAYSRDCGASVKRVPMLRDFHMVGSGYDASDDGWQSLMIPKKKDGKPPSNTTGTKLTHRYYLQDMAFAVAIEGPGSLVDQAAEALRAPVWDLYLGRKCCVPSEIIAQGIYSTAEDAFNKAQVLAGEKNYKPVFKVMQGQREEANGEVLTLSDVPVKFGPDKMYRDRKVTVEKLA
ncbi:MAG: type I-E CRISPR-associated protein Cas5/CasD [Candidatus Dadabacteria bacterium]|nr:MAG: type I-E CRISPR-associated protein Cas5/CasD [Candidatus Dadabacteria bacterium]